MLAIVGSEGQPSPPVFVSAGELPRLKRASPDGHYIFYQDGGPCHAALTNRQFLVASMAVYWPPEPWPPPLPYLHPLEYSMLSVF